MTITPTNTTTPQTLYTQQSGSTSSNPFITFYSLRDPTPNDINYPIQKRWVNFALTREWILESFVSTSGASLANWVLLNSNGFAAINTITGDDGIIVTPTITGTINLNGNIVANGLHSKPLFTESPAPNTERIDLQLSTAIPATDPTLTKVGVSVFNSSQFTVDANGFVSLVGGGGGGLTKLAVQSGTSPVVPDGTGQITFNGARVAAGTNPVRTDGTGVSTVALEVQTSQAIPATNATNVGLAAFNSAQFTVDANGFVSLIAPATKAVVLAYLNTGLNNVTGDGTGPNPLIFDTTVTNIGGAYNTATGIFTAPVTGNYLVACNVMFNNLLTSHNLGEIIFQKPIGGNYTKVINNPGLNQTQVTGYTQVNSLMLTGIVDLLATQQFQINVDVYGSAHILLAYKVKLLD